MANEPPWTVEQYKDARGRLPVAEFIDSLDRRVRTRVARSIALLAMQGLRLGMPHARQLAGYGLFELRVQSARIEVRIIYYAAREQRIVLLHGFLKKTEATPQRELDTAVRRRAEFEAT